MVFTIFFLLVYRVCNQFPNGCLRQNDFHVCDIYIFTDMKIYKLNGIMKNCNKFHYIFHIVTTQNTISVVSHSIFINYNQGNRFRILQQLQVLHNKYIVYISFFPTNKKYESSLSDLFGPKSLFNALIFAEIKKLGTKHLLNVTVDVE